MDAFISPNGRIPLRLLACDGFVVAAMGAMDGAVKQYCQERDNLQALCMKSLLSKNMTVMSSFVEWNDWLEKAVTKKGLSDVLGKELGYLRSLFAQRMKRMHAASKDKPTMSYQNSCNLFHEAERLGFESRIWGSYEQFVSMGCVNKPEVLHPASVFRPKSDFDYGMQEFSRAAFFNSSQFDGDSIRFLESALDMVFHAYNYSFPDVTLADAHAKKFPDSAFEDPMATARAMVERFGGVHRVVRSGRLSRDDIVFACASRLGHVFGHDLDEEVPLGARMRIDKEISGDESFKGCVARVVVRVLDNIRSNIDPCSIKYVA